jgi:hypothetical protein
VNIAARTLAPLALLWPLAGCIGQQASTTELPSQTPDLCAQPVDPGPCEAAFPRWAFDPQTGTCGQFTWGGCGGNTNNFVTEAACAATCGATVGPQYCGGWNPQPCDANEFCDFPRDGCDWADASGTCQPRPQACDAVYDPVCGCNGVTYGNLCEAQAAGFDAASSGPCEQPPPTGVSCGGWSGNTCGADEFCDFEFDYCDWADASGVCRPRPEVCDDVYDPVCGCNGVTYGNLCEAQANGIDAALPGACNPTPPPAEACEDQQRDAIILGGSRTFGFCAESCRRMLDIVPALTGNASCDEVVLEICDNDRNNTACTHNTGVLSPATHAAIRAAALALNGVALDATYGCPDCADGGAAEVHLQRPNMGAPTSHIYPFREAPDVLKDADAIVQALIDDLSTCQSSSRITVNRGCTPR